MKEARARRDFIAGELAAGRDPRLALQAVAAGSVTQRRLADFGEPMVASRIDVDDDTKRNYRKHLLRLGALGELDPQRLTVSDVQEWVGSNADLKPSTLRAYLSTVRLLLDYAEAEPNPARDRRLRLPKLVQEEPEPPTAEHVLALLELVPHRWRLPLVVMEQTAAPVGEVGAWEWRDADLAGNRIRSRRSIVKAGNAARARWLQVPDWLMALVSHTCPADDRTPERRLFPGFTDDRARKAMTRACRAAGIPHYHPHDFRHRRISLWHGQGIPQRELAARSGHSRATMSLSVYSHVMPLDEVPVEKYVKLLNAFVPVVEGRHPGVVPVCSDDAE
jgi:integrase